VSEAADGEEALALIAAEPPHVILTELNLPSMPAGRLVQWLAQSWRTRGIPIIVLASDVHPSDSQELRSLASVSGVLMKPFPLGRMVEEIRRTLRGGGREAGNGH
jgi:CheY-like chemotaxis protein